MRAGRAGRGQRADRPARSDRGGPRDPGARRAAHKDTPPWRTFPRVRPADRGTRRGRRPTNSGPPGARGGAGCPNLLQRPRSGRSAGEESLVFRAFIRGRSCRGAPLWQIWTHPRPGPPQESHPHHPAPSLPAPPRRSPPDHAGRVCGIGLVGTELHIRPGPAIGGSAESCGNASAFNAGEILPCADRGPLHMGERQRKVDNSQESRNHAENPRSAREGAPLRCAIPPLSPRGARATSRARPRPDPAVGATGSAGSALTRASPLSRGAPEPAPSIKAWAAAPRLLHGA